MNAQFDAREAMRATYLALATGLIVALIWAWTMLWPAFVQAAPLNVNDNGHRAMVLIGGRPEGCPVKYCGCGLRKYLGIDDKRLDDAAEWPRQFARTLPAPGMVGVRRDRRHVMLLVAHVRGTRWLVRNYNGRRHLSYIYARDVRGFFFVDPTTRLAVAR